jgi:hypothetical protein
MSWHTASAPQTRKARFLKAARARIRNIAVGYITPSCPASAEPANKVFLKPSNDV